jgi:hemerythrin-like domain-containing protein
VAQEELNMTDPQDDPLAQFESEHHAMRRLFVQWRALSSRPSTTDQRQALAEQICLELAIHTRLEEELLYPLAREVTGDADMLDGSVDEHAAARDLMCRVLLMRADDERFDAGVTVLCDYVERHMDGEGRTLFPRLRRSGVDFGLLGRRLRERRRELEAVPEALREDALASAVA